MYWAHNDGLPLVLAIVIALLAASAVGAINGLITVRLNVPSFVTTLATNFILYGVVLVGSNDAQGEPDPAERGDELHQPVDGILEVGRDPLGGRDHDRPQCAAHAHAVRRSDRRHRRQPRRRGRGGHAIRRVKVWCFVLCSFVAGLVGIVDAVKYGTLDPGNFGVDYILYAIGACVIGGTALTGGRGTVVGALIGAILIGLLEDGLTLIGVSADEFFIWVGVVIIAAMALNVQFDRLIARSRGG